MELEIEVFKKKQMIPFTLIPLVFFQTIFLE